MTRTSRHQLTRKETNTVCNNTEGFVKQKKTDVKTNGDFSSMLPIILYTPLNLSDFIECSFLLQFM